MAKLLLSHLKGGEVVSPELLGKDCRCQTFFFFLQWKICWCWKAGDFFSDMLLWRQIFGWEHFPQQSSVTRSGPTRWGRTLCSYHSVRYFHHSEKVLIQKKKECEGQPAGFLLEAGGSGLRPFPVICQNCDAHLKHLRTSLLCFPQTVGEMGSATLWGKPGRVFTNYYSFTRCSHPSAFVRLSYDTEYWSVSEFTPRQPAFSLFITVASALKRRHQYSVQPVTQASPLPTDTTSGIKSLLNHYGFSGSEMRPKRQEDFQNKIGK